VSDPAARPGRTLPPGKTRYPFYKRLGGPQGRSGGVENLVPTGIRSRTVHPVAQSLYRLSYRAQYSVIMYGAQVAVYSETNVKHINRVGRKYNYRLLNLLVHHVISRLYSSAIGATS